jgi:hypothetical protein
MTALFVKYQWYRREMKGEKGEGDWTFPHAVYGDK